MKGSRDHEYRQLLQVLLCDDSTARRGHGVKGGFSFLNIGDITVLLYNHEDDPVKRKI